MATSIATVRMMQEKYAEAVAGHEEVLTIFEQQNEPAMVAAAWHQIGIVHQKAGNYDEAEAAYRRSLEIETQTNDRAGQASSLTQLGILYGDHLGRPEEAVTFSRQAADIYVELGDLRYEGFARNNIAITLHKLKRYDEARLEILRAIECDRQFGHAAKPWTSFATLHLIEAAAGNQAAAQAAWAQARAAYLAYRQQGGYAQAPGGRWCDQLLPALQQGDSAEIAQELEKLAQAPNTPGFLKLSIPKLIQIANGSRDLALADDPALDYDDAAEILFLIERLGE